MDSLYIDVSTQALHCAAMVLCHVLEVGVLSMPGHASQLST